MASWMFETSDFQATPSIKAGLGRDQECILRKEGVFCIIDLGNAMNLPDDTVATAVVFFHRFYMCRSFTVFPHFVTATACMFLAGKVEETPKKSHILMMSVRAVLNDKQYDSFGSDEKKTLVAMENELLHTLCFDWVIIHPYKYLVQYAKTLQRAEEKVITEVVRIGWRFVKYSLGTTLCLQWEPEIIAIAIMFLACKLMVKSSIWEGNHLEAYWWNKFVEDLDTDTLENICLQILDVCPPEAVLQIITASNQPAPVVIAVTKKSSSLNRRVLKEPRPLRTTRQKGRKEKEPTN